MRWRSRRTGPGWSLAAPTMGGRGSGPRDRHPALYPHRAQVRCGCSRDATQNDEALASDRRTCTRPTTWIRSPLGLESHGGRALAGGHQGPRRSAGWTGSARHHGRPVPVIVSSGSCPASSPGAGGAWRGTDRPGGSWSGTRHSSAVPVPAGFADLTDLSADAMSSSTGARSTGPHTGRMADLERAHPRAAHSALRRNDRVAECSACSSSPREAGLGAVAAGGWLEIPVEMAPVIDVGDGAATTAAGRVGVV